MSATERQERLEDGSVAVDDTSLGADELREPTWFEAVVADAVVRYDALPDHLKPIVVVSRAH